MPEAFDFAAKPERFVTPPSVAGESGPWKSCTVASPEARLQSLGQQFDPAGETGPEKLARICEKHLRQIEAEMSACNDKHELSTLRIRRDEVEALLTYAQSRKGFRGRVRRKLRNPPALLHKPRSMKSLIADPPGTEDRQAFRNRLIGCFRAGDVDPQ